MTNKIIQQIEAEQMNKEIPAFAPGDTVIVSVNVVEGSRKRVQAYEGVCIARKSAGISSSFTVRKISHGYGVERVFQSHSALIDSVQVKRRGAVRAVDDDTAWVCNHISDSISIVDSRCPETFTTSSRRPRSWRHAQLAAA
mgnify:CR=1 FL=1